MIQQDQKDKEKFVSENLKDIVLSMLQEQPMCGYDLIKAIFQRHDVVVSQGRVYPLLYSLEQRGLLRCELKCNARVKVYSLSTSGRNRV